MIKDKYEKGTIRVYRVYCSHCDEPFIILKKVRHKNPFCPTCGDNYCTIIETEEWSNNFKRSRKHYSDQEDEIILYSRKKGLSWDDIGKLMKRSPNGVRNRWRLLNDKVKRTTS